MAKKKLFTTEELDQVLAEKRDRVRVKAQFLLPYAGGMAAGEKELRAFIEHHLGLLPGTPEFDSALARIRKEEMVATDTTPPEGELQTEEVYGVKIIRRGEPGPFVAAHQIKAVLKVVATRFNIFKSSMGSKGDIVEMGSIFAVGDSLQNPARPWEIYLRKNGGLAPTSFRVIAGNPSTPKGKRAIQTHVEIAEEGSVVEFEIHWLAKKFSKDDMILVLAGIGTVGLGSCLSLEYGKFKVLEAELL